MDKRDRIIELWKENRSPYYVSVELGITIKEVYHYIRQHEDAKMMHKKQLEANKESEPIYR